jgi:glutathione peroxidase
MTATFSGEQTIHPRIYTMFLPKLPQSLLLGSLGTLVAVCGITTLSWLPSSAQSSPHESVASSIKNQVAGNTRDESSSRAAIDWASVRLTGLDGAALDTSRLKNRVVLVVNVASKCGFTSQYEGLQALYEEKGESGLIVLGVPSNQFGGQEPGQPEEIQNFCRRNYGVTFPLLEKQDVKGDSRSLLYKKIARTDKGEPVTVRWNFEKFLVGRSGKVLAHFRSTVAPDSPELRDAIDKALKPETATY